MGSVSEGYKSHVLMVPFNAQGHISPMLQIAKRLIANGVKVTISYSKLLAKKIPVHALSSVEVATISDGSGDAGPPLPTSVNEYLENFKIIGGKQITELVANSMKSSLPFTAIIYDSCFQWLRDIAKEFNLAPVPLLTQSLAVNFIYYQIHKGVLSLPLTDGTISIPGFPDLDVLNVPYSVGPIGDGVGSGNGLFPTIQSILINQLQGTEQDDWVLATMFRDLEPEISDWFGQRFRLAVIGPTIPSMYVDQRIEDDESYGLSYYTVDKSATACARWLEGKPAGSVVYVSFGSVVTLGKEQMEEIAWGLRQSGRHFVWVVRATEADKLPENYAADVSEKGLVVSWCHQMEVLAHESVGCFVSHCGFNSLIEAVSLGVPMVAIPVISDQPTNATYVEEVWKVGIRPVFDEARVVRRDAVVDCIKMVMESDKGREMKLNAMKLKDLAKKALSEGGSSDQAMGDFVQHLINRGR